MTSEPLSHDPTEPASEHGFATPASPCPLNRFAKRKLVSLEEAETPQPQPLSSEFPPTVNRLAYKLQTNSVKTIRWMMYKEDHSWTTTIICADGATGLLMSFRDYEALSRFYEWTTEKNITRPLITTASLACGDTSVGSKVHKQAQKLMDQLAADRKITIDDMSFKTEDDDSGICDECPHFFPTLEKGFYCSSCMMAHNSVIPHDGF